MSKVPRTIRINGKDYPAKDIKICPDDYDGRHVCVQETEGDEQIALYLDRDINYTLKGIRTALKSGFLQLDYDEYHDNMVITFRKDVVDKLLNELKEAEKPHSHHLDDVDYIRIIEEVNLCRELVDYCSPCQDEFSEDDFDNEKITNLFLYRNQRTQKDVIELSINGIEYLVVRDNLILEIETHIINKDEYICKGYLYNLAEDKMQYKLISVRSFKDDSLKGIYKWIVSVYKGQNTKRIELNYGSGFLDMLNAINPTLDKFKTDQSFVTLNSIRVVNSD